MTQKQNVQKLVHENSYMAMPDIALVGALIEFNKGSKGKFPEEELRILHKKMNEKSIVFKREIFGDNDDDADELRLIASFFSQIKPIQYIIFTFFDDSIGSSQIVYEDNSN